MAVVKVEVKCPRCGEPMDVDVDEVDLEIPEYSADVCDACAEEMYADG